LPDAADLLDVAWAYLVSGGPDTQDRPALELSAPAETAGLASRYQVAEMAVACVGLALLAATNLAEQPGFPRRTVTLHPAHVGVAVVSERHFRVNGRLSGPGFAPLSRFWETADGWVRTHANYPWHLAALLEALAVQAQPDQIAAAMRELPSVVVEEQVMAAGGVASAVRSAAQWAVHDQGRALSEEPLIGHRSIAGAVPRHRKSGPLPADGVRVVDLTRVIAGPVCTRYLGALGAEVLRIDPPQKPDMARRSIADTLLAKRSSSLDLTRPKSVRVLHDLLDEADIVVCGYRPGSLERFGLDADHLAEDHPGLVIVQLSAWGHSGPWAQRRGFDSIVQAAAGIAAGESTDSGEPGTLPCQLLDHGTGYLAAAAALDGLRRQSDEGGTHVRTVSLGRTALWLVRTANGQQTIPAAAAKSSAKDWIVEVGGVPHGASAVAPPGALDGEALQWPGPPARYLNDEPAWEPRIG
jgi:crotonobetainyl-CoA:carnitine CoA-transferase CaiB-like acyl-CoA transferase